MNDLLSRLVRCRKARGNMDGKGGLGENSFEIASAFILPIYQLVLVCVSVKRDTRV